MELLNKTVASISAQDQQAREEAKARLDQLIMPHWALGKLMDLAIELAGMTGTIKPAVERKRIVTMAGDHGITASGVSAYPADVTIGMIAGILNGVAGVNVLARQAGAEVTLVDMGVADDLSAFPAGAIVDRKVAMGTADFSKGPAMSREQAVQALENGIEVAFELAETTDVFGTGELGIGNTSPSSAIISVLCGLPLTTTTGRGAGVDDEQLKQKIAVIQRGIDINKPDANDPIDVLAKVGGLEIAGVAGMIIGAAAKRKPVIVDGFISTAAALVAGRIAPMCREYMISAHKSVEIGQKAALEDLGKEPMLDLNFRLGEGTGAAMAMNLVEGAVAILTEMATFAEAGVSEAL